jgi:nucleoside 2-deoxyribosyltransferase
MNISSTVGNDDTMFGAGFSVALDKPMANGMSKVQLVKTVNAQADEIVTMKREMAQQKAEIAELKKAVAQMQNK